jgi:hypothetical protein
MFTHSKPYLLLLFVAMSGTLAAQTPDVSGTWLSNSDASLKWILDQKSGTIHVQELVGDKVEADFTCPLTGQECAAKESGRAEKVMMYFNGNKLVQICEHGNSSVKKRLVISPDGKTLTVNTVPLSSDQKAETISFRRQST